MRPLPTVVLLLLLGLGFARGSEWKLIRHDGRDHVTLQNVADFYGLGNPRRVGNGIALGAGNRSLSGSRGSAELYINGLKFILSYPIAEKDGELLVSRMDLTKLIEPVMRPSRIRNTELVNTIVLDPGHGGHDRGARSPLGDEAQFTLDVALKAKNILEQQGWRVVMTRRSDVFVSLDDRVRYANRFSNALFISIHFNSGQPHATGVETFTLAPRGVPSMASDGPKLSDLQPCAGNARDAENMALATATHAAMVRLSGLYDRGIKRARFVVIRDVTIPGVLLEGGFLSNRGDNRKVASTLYRQQLAAAILTAANNYKKAVGRPPQELMAGKSVDLRPLSPQSPGSKPNEPVVLTPRTD